MKTALMCFGSHGRDIAAWLGSDLGGIYDDDDSLGFPPLRNCTDAAIIGINSPRKRRELWERYSPGYPEPLVPAPWRFDCQFGFGVVVAPSVVLVREVRLGRHTHVNYGASMTRTTIGDFCTISPGAVICGDVTIENEVLIGAGAVICDRVHIGKGATVGAGAVVLPGSTVAAGATVVGVPAR